MDLAFRSEGGIALPSLKTNLIQTTLLILLIINLNFKLEIDLN